MPARSPGYRALRAAAKQVADGESSTICNGAQLLASMRGFFTITSLPQRPAGRADHALPTLSYTMNFAMTRPGFRRRNGTEPIVVNMHDFEDAARGALAQAAHLAGLPTAEWSTVRIGERGVFRRADLVAKVARSRSRFSHAKREVAVAAWLAASDVPVEQPLADAVPDERVELPVSFWHAVDGDWTTPDRLAEVLQVIHKLTPPDDLQLPQLNPFPRMRQRLDGAANLDATQRQQVEALIDRYEPQLPAALAVNQRPNVVLHGDANIGNILVRTDSNLAMLDLEGVCVGPVAWDLMITAVYRDLGWHTDAEYAAFCNVIGCDVTLDPAWPTLKAVQELRMTCWLAQKAALDRQVAEEFATRIADLGDPHRPRRWRPY